MYFIINNTVENAARRAIIVSFYYTTQNTHSLSFQLIRVIFGPDENPIETSDHFHEVIFEYPSSDEFSFDIFEIGRRDIFDVFRNVIPFVFH